MQQTLFRSFFALITGLFWIAAVSAVRAEEPTTTTTTTTNPSEYRIGIEDVLDISVRNNADLQKVVPVRPDGKISLPLINDIVVVGLTPMELRDVLTEKFSAFVQRPDVSIVVREIHSYKVSIIGSVKTPGRYELKGPSTVLDALALAEGFTEFASRRKITILRRDGENVQRLRFDYFAAVNGSGERNLLVKPGDIIIVP